MVTMANCGPLMQLRVAGLDALAFDLHISEAAFDRRCFSVPSCEAHRRVTVKEPGTQWLQWLGIS